MQLCQRNKDWRCYISSLDLPGQSERATRIDAFLSRYGTTDVPPPDSPAYKRLLEIKSSLGAAR